MSPTEWSGEPISPQGMLDRAKAIAEQLLPMPTEASHRELADLKVKNQTLHALVVECIRDTRSKGFQP